MATLKVAIVTGASSGIGQSTAALLAEVGYAVALVARREAPLRAAAEAIAHTVPAAPPTLVLPADVSDPAAPRQIIDAVLNHFGRIDAVVNAAGSAPLMPIEQITPQTWQACVNSNLSSVVLMTAAVWPTFQRQHSGIVVNISSMSSIDPFPGFSMYAAAKVGVNLFTKCTADEGKPLGVRAVAVAPGAVETPMLRQNFPEQMIAPSQTLAPSAIARVIRDCITGAQPFEPGETIILASPSGDEDI